jgi:hypothetical protein
MQLKSVLFCVLSLFVFVSVHPVIAAPSDDPCVLPPRLRDKISKEYPDRHIITLADLDDYDRESFLQNHRGRCPGIVKVNFYGDGNPTWALVLISGENPKRIAELVVAHHMANRWETRCMEKTDGTPVVWSEGPGKYEDISGGKTIRAKYPVVVFCGYESWAIVYAWTGKEAEKIWISDWVLHPSAVFFLQTHNSFPAALI